MGISMSNKRSAAGLSSSAFETRMSEISDCIAAFMH